MTVHVGILVVQVARTHCGAMNWLLLRAVRCSERFSGTFNHAGKYRIHSCRRN